MEKHNITKTKGNYVSLNNSHRNHMNTKGLLPFQQGKGLRETDLNFCQTLLIFGRHEASTGFIPQRQELHTE